MDETNDEFLNQDYMGDEESDGLDEEDEDADEDDEDEEEDA